MNIAAFLEPGDLDALLDEGSVVGAARRAIDETDFRQRMCEALKKHSRTGHGDSESCDPFVSNL